MIGFRGVLSASLAIVAAIALSSCGGEKTVVPVPEASVLHEPPAFCLGGSDSSRTLTVYNQGPGALDWNPVSVPEGAEGLIAVTVDPDGSLDLSWTWAPPGPYPVLDTLVVSTNDPDNRMIRIPLRRDNPAGVPDLNPPAAPFLFTPENGAEFAVGDSTILTWSRLDDCSGIRHYRLEISTTADFRNVVCCGETIPDAGAKLFFDPGDEGTAYWRIYGVDGANLRGLPSDPRTWTVR
jgi:hypothetical protein